MISGLFFFLQTLINRRALPHSSSVPSFAKNKFESQFFVLSSPSYPWLFFFTPDGIGERIRSQDTPTCSSALTVSGEAKGRLPNGRQALLIQSMIDYTYSIQIFPSADTVNIQLPQWAINHLPFGINCSFCFHSFRKLSHTGSILQNPQSLERRRNI